MENADLKVTHVMSTNVVGRVTLMLALITQAGAIVWWGSALDARVRELETRGSVQAANAMSRIAALEFRFNQTDERSADHAAVNIQLSRLDERIIAMRGTVDMIARAMIRQTRELEKIVPAQDAPKAPIGAWQP